MREQEPSWPTEKKPDPSNGVRPAAAGESEGEESSDDDEEEGSTEDMSVSEEEEGSISDEYDSDTSWDEAKLEAANERKYWSR